MGSRFRNRIVGLVRFSYAALSGFQRTTGDGPSVETQLMTRERLDRRFALFEGFALPSLKAQSDGGFETLVLTGTALPKWALERLTDRLAGLDGARIVQLPPMHHYPATQRAFAAHPDDKATHLTSFRLDDDDALDIHHIARLRRMAEGMMQAVNPDQPFCIGHNRGLFLDLSTRTPEWAEVTEKLPLGIGLAMTAPVASGENIFRRNHRLLPQFFTTLTEAETHAYIRTIHPGNDSEAKPSGVAAMLGDEQVAAILSRSFPFLGQGALK